MEKKKKKIRLDTKAIKKLRPRDLTQVQGGTEPFNLAIDDMSTVYGCCPAASNSARTCG